jgi:hypothetical protein
VAGRDITEGRGSATAGIGRAIAVDLGIVSSTSVWQNTTESYDVAVGGLPFFYAIADDRPYIRQTAPFRKEQQDIGAEPGEQSLTGWWLRSQSSFHNGTGIKFYDPSAGETVAYRFADSQNVDVWTKGQVTLLKESTNTAVSTDTYKIISAVSGTTDVVIGYIPGSTTIKSFDSTGTPVTTYTPTGLGNILDGAVCTDGTRLFVADADHIYTGPINAASVGWTEYYVSGSRATLAWAKQRLVSAIENKIYELTGTTIYASTINNAAVASGTVTLTTSAVHGLLVGDTVTVTDLPSPFTAYNGAVTVTAVGSTTTFSYVVGVATVTTAATTGKFLKTTLPAPTYTHPNTDWEWTSISEGGVAIYAAGYAGGNSAIYKFTLDSTTGVMPVLTSGVIAAQLPSGETVNKIETYLGYMMIGTNKGVRVANISDQDGSLSYGPLVIEATNTGLDFAFRDRFVWVTGAIDSQPGLYRIDLGAEIEQLRFAYATDASLSGVTGYATSVDFVGNSDQIAFTTSGSDGIAIQSATVLASTGYLTTGKIRFSTLEPKNFKRLIARGSFTVGETLLSSIATNPSGSETEYDHISYNSGVNPVEVTTSVPQTAQEFLAYKFTLSRDATDTTAGPTFKGYQAKATIATPRQRMIRFPAYCFDIETDRFNTVIGYEGRAFDRIKLLEQIEQTGDVLTWQDLTTGESQQAVIEEVTFTRMTPPDKRFDGFGGVLQITVRTV